MEVTFLFVTPKSSRSQALMLYRPLAADAREEFAGASAMQGRRSITALTSGYLLTR
jgi:hypothetical protein